MKNLIKGIPLIFIIASMLFSCNKRSQSVENAIKFDSINVTKVYNLNNDSTKPSCNLKISFVYPTSYNNKTILADVQSLFLYCILGDNYKDLDPKEAISKYSENYIKNYTEDAAIFFRDKDIDRGDTEDKTPSDDSYFSYYESLTNSIKFNKGDIIAFQVHQNNYKGGGTSFQQYVNYNIDLKTGKIITEEDIFLPDYEKTLNTLFQEKLKAANKVKSINELEDIGYFGIDEIAPNNNMLIQEDGILYTFNKGEYSVLQLDEINIFIPYGEIISILKANSPISTFAQL